MYCNCAPKTFYAYNYDGNGKLINNRLRSVSDAASSNETGELTGTSNYTYDPIGNLIADSKEGITNIDWNVYGKIRSITKANPINYTYDATGNRASKLYNGKTTWYVRDAQGNQLATYDNNETGIKWKEQLLYGSSRLGMWKLDFNLAVDSGQLAYALDGRKFFEDNNHLGNTMAVISDNRIVNGSTFEPVVISAQDYYAFGSQMPGRQAGTGYKFGFNGKENDNEVKGEGNQQDYGMRIYDPRIAKFLSVDPLSKSYPWYTPYQFAGNSPISNVDVDGAEPNWFMINAEAGMYGKTVQKIARGTREGMEASVTNTYNFFTKDAYKVETWKQTVLFIEEIALSSSPHSTIYNPSTPRLDAAVKSLERDVINGDAYTRSKFGGQLFADIATAYLSSKGISSLSTAAKVAVRTNLAQSFYEKFAESNIASKLEGINFAKPVRTRTLAKGTEVIQWVGDDGKVGKYFAPVGTDPATLGINLEAKGGGLRSFKLTDDVKVLESTAADYKGNKGGGTQYFSPKLKDKVAPTTKGN